MSAMRRVNSLGSIDLRKTTSGDFLPSCGNLDSSDATGTGSILSIISGLDDLQKSLQSKLTTLTTGKDVYGNTRLPSITPSGSRAKLSLARDIRVRSQSQSGALHQVDAAATIGKCADPPEPLSKGPYTRGRHHATLHVTNLEPLPKGLEPLTRKLELGAIRYSPPPWGNCIAVPSPQVKTSSTLQPHAQTPAFFKATSVKPEPLQEKATSSQHPPVLSSSSSSRPRRLSVPAASGVQDRHPWDKTSEQERKHDSDSSPLKSTLRPHTSQPSKVDLSSTIILDLSQPNKSNLLTTKSPQQNKKSTVTLRPHTSQPTVGDLSTSQPTVVDQYLSSTAPTQRCAQVRGEKYASCVTLQTALQANGWTQCTGGQEPIGGWDLKWGSSADITREAFGAARCSSAWSRVCLVNHFCKDRCKTVANKGCLLHLLRTVHQDSLLSWAPRSYDLSRVHERKIFMTDFVESAAESLASKASTGTVVSTAILRAALDVLKTPSSSMQSTQAGESGDKSMEKRADRFSCALRYQNCASEDAAGEALCKEALEVMQERAKDPQRQVHISSSQNLWLVKKSNLENGDGVMVDQRLPEIIRIASESFDWGCVVQKYVERPLVLEGRKMDLRIWMLISSWAPMQAWLWSEPYARLASKSFNFESLHIQDPLVHLTNRSQQKKDPQQKSGDKLESQAHCWTLPTLLDWLRGPGGYGENAWEKQAWPKIVALARRLLVALETIRGSEPPKGVKCFEILGVDVLLDDSLNPWFLEANTSPDLCNDADPALQESVGRCLQSGLAVVKRSRDEPASKWLPSAADVDACADGLSLAGADSWRLIKANR